MMKQNEKKADLKRELEEGGDLYDTDKKDKNETDDTNKALYRNVNMVLVVVHQQCSLKKSDIYSSAFMI